MSTPLSRPGLSVQPPQALGAHVTAQLRRLIISAELVPGTHLVEAQLSATFDVSRGPVRDALRLLETEGLVASRRRGVFVVGLRPADVEELYSLREILELKALELIDPGQPSDAGDDRWAPLVEPVELMRTAAGSRDVPAFAEADLAFHGALYTLAGHSRLERVWRQYEPTFAVLLGMTNAEDLDLGPACDDHVRLCELVVAGDHDEAATALRAHLEGSRHRLQNAYDRILRAAGAEASG